MGNIGSKGSGRSEYEEVFLSLGPELEQYRIGKDSDPATVERYKEIAKDEFLGRLIESASDWFDKRIKSV